MPQEIKFYKDVLINPNFIPFSAGVVVVGVYSDEEHGIDHLELCHQVYITGTDTARMHECMELPLKAAEQIVEKLTDWKDRYTSIYEELGSGRHTLHGGTKLVEWQHLYEDVIHRCPKKLYDILMFGEGSYWYQSKLPVEYTKTLISLLDKMIAEYLEVIRRLETLDIFS